MEKNNKTKGHCVTCASHPTGEAQVRHEAQSHGGPGWAQAGSRGQGAVWSPLDCSFLGRCLDQTEPAWPWGQGHPLQLSGQAPPPHTLLLCWKKIRSLFGFRRLPAVAGLSYPLLAPPATRGRQHLPSVFRTPGRSSFLPTEPGQPGGLMGWMPLFLFKKGVSLFPCRLPSPLNVQGSLTHTALESPGARAAERAVSVALLPRHGSWDRGVEGPRRLALLSRTPASLLLEHTQSSQKVGRSLQLGKGLEEKPGQQPWDSGQRGSRTFIYRRSWT